MVVESYVVANLVASKVAYPKLSLLEIFFSLNIIRYGSAASHWKEFLLTSYAGMR